MRSILLVLGVPIAIYACHRAPTATPAQPQAVTNMQPAPRPRAAAPQQAPVVNRTTESAPHDAGLGVVPDGAVLQTIGIRPDGEEVRVPAPVEHGNDAGASETPATHRDLESARDGGSSVSPPDMIADGGARD